MCQIIFCILCLSFSETAVDDLLLKIFFGGFIILFLISFAAQFHLYSICTLCSLSTKQSCKTSGLYFRQLLDIRFDFCWLIFMRNFILVLFACRKRKLTFVVFVVITIFVMVQFLILVMLIVELLPCILWCSQSLCHFCFTNIWTVFPQSKDFQRVQRLAKRRFP